jgi:hypothetical protein
VIGLGLSIKQASQVLRLKIWDGIQDAFFRARPRKLFGAKMAVATLSPKEALQTHIDAANRDYILEPRLGEGSNLQGGKRVVDSVS